ncbi:MAG: hypothetical protein KME17_17215 [Cyanosarcina radialis HA8281-LM2]|nr:hypothetical protein [Cyanosarcina radialis HA8281-LM2]
MKSLQADSEAAQTLGVKGAERWEIYWRLQQLDIPAQCATNQPLKAQITSPAAVVQVWSVVRQTTAPRRELVLWLHRCWQAE